MTEDEKEKVVEKDIMKEDKKKPIEEEKTEKTEKKTLSLKKTNPFIKTSPMKKKKVLPKESSPVLTKKPIKRRKKSKKPKGPQKEVYEFFQEFQGITSKEKLRSMYKEKFRKYVKRKVNETAYKYHKYDPYSPSVKLVVGGDIPFQLLARTLHEIENTSGRIKKNEMLTNCFRSIIAHSPSPKTLMESVYMATSQVYPKFNGIELGIGDGLLTKVITEVSGKKIANVRQHILKSGDLGISGEKLCSLQSHFLKPKPLSITFVFGTFRQIANLKGKSSRDAKIGLIKKLLVSSRKHEVKYIIKSLQGSLRIGMGEESVLSCLGHAILLSVYKKEDKNITLKKAEDLVKLSYYELPHYEKLIPCLFQHGLMKLHDFVHITPGIPVKPMLAQPSKEVAAVFERFGKSEFTCEYKYDGERGQLHYMNKGDEVKIFSRNLEDSSGKFPEIPDILRNLIKDNVTTAIFDCEIVAFDQETGKIRSFQQLSHRGRKNIVVKDITVTVCLFLFDILLLNGDSLMDLTLRERRIILKDSFTPQTGKVELVRYLDTSDQGETLEFFNKAIKEGTEGLILKKLDIKYEPAKRSFHWLKLKKDYVEGMADTIDVVPIGAYMGRGKRTGLLGGFLFAIYDPDSEEYQPICKTGTGFTDKQLKEFTEKLTKLKIDGPKSYYQLSKNIKPDIWLEPKYVWEIKGADLSISPEYTAAFGLVDPGRGISLRFPRFLREREDKKCDEASTSYFIKRLYQQQTNN